ncbi:MAG: OmpH family outer membrane protein [Candidatus Azobacteroides sp.]|nr:OmpH family outer membrane protein [Candidatus Azobacteroides sp.]
MLKKIVLLALLIIPMGAIAQEKIAYFNSADVITAMPEYTQMMDSLQRTQTAIESELNVLREEYEKKYNAFMAEADKLVENIKVRRMQELQDIEDRAQTFQQQSQQKMMQVQQDLLKPIQQKVKSALDAIGEENNFAYIIEVSNLVFINAKSIDATPLVKKRLGLK